MNKVNILFVVSGISVGGVTSCLKAILHSSIVDNYNLSVLSLKGSDFSPRDGLCKIVVHKSVWSRAVYMQFSEMSLIQKLTLFPLKFLFKLPIIGECIKKFILNVLVAKIEKRDKYDCVVAFQETYPMEFVSHFRQLNKILWVHSDYARVCNGVRKGFKYLSKYRKIVFVSNFTKRAFLKLFPEFKDKVETVYNFVSPEIITLNSYENNNEIKINKSFFSIISIGRIDKVKRFSLIPQIANELRNRGCKFRWYIMGPPVGAGDELRVLYEEIDKFALNKIVSYIGAKVNPAPYMKHANLLVALSETEACPMIFNEAKVLGLPIVSSNFGSASEFVEEGRDGYVVDVSTLASLLSEIIANPHKYNFSPRLGYEFTEGYFMQRFHSICCR